MGGVAVARGGGIGVVVLATEEAGEASPTVQATLEGSLRAAEEPLLRLVELELRPARACITLSGMWLLKMLV